MRIGSNMSKNKHMSCSLHPEVKFEGDDQLSIPTCETTPLIKQKRDVWDLSFNTSDYRCQSTTTTVHSTSTSIFSNLSNFSSQYLTPSLILQSDVTKSRIRDTLKSMQSVVLHSSMILTMGERMPVRDASFLLTIGNILPMIQGAATFAMPFAVVTGGIMFIPIAIMLSLIADVTGCLLIKCLYTDRSGNNSNKRVYLDIRDIARSCWGQWGYNLVHYFLIFFMVTHNIVCVVVLGKCFYVLLRSMIPVTEMQMTLIFSVVFLPPLFIRKLSILAVFGFIGVLSISIGVVTALAVFIQHASHWVHHARALALFNVNGIPISIAIFMYSILLNTILPEIESSMIKPEQIGAAIHISYGISTVFKLAFGVFGALTFGVETKQLISVNVAEYSLIARYVMTIAVLSYIVTNFALLYFVIYEKLDKYVEGKLSTKFGVGRKVNIIWLIFSRIVGVFATTVVGISVPFFGFVAGIVGSITGTGVAFLFPVLFHLQLKWNDICVGQKVVEILLMVFGGVIGALSIYSTLTALIKQIIAL